MCIDYTTWQSYYLAMSNEIPMPEIKFTLGFCVVPTQNRVLMVHRAKSPNKGLWNGLGGKIDYDQGESHYECIVREVGEETDELIDLIRADELRYAGVVTWDSTRGEN